MGLDAATVLGSTVGQYPEQGHILSIEERQDLVVQEVGCCQSGLVRIHLGETHVGMGVDGGLLVDFANAFDGSDVFPFRAFRTI